MARQIRIRPTLSRLVPLATVLMSFLLVVKLYLIARDVGMVGPEDSGGNLLIGQAHAGPQATGTVRSSSEQPTGNAQVDVQKPAQIDAQGSTPGDERCRDHVDCDGVPPPAPLDDGQKELIHDITTRAQNLADESQALAERKRFLDAASVVLEQKFAAATTSASKRGVNLSDEDSARLVTIYQAMKPADAAAIFDVLDLRMCVALLERMPPRRASAIMESMSPQRAILATQMLAGRQPNLIPVAGDGG